MALSRTSKLPPTACTPDTNTPSETPVLRRTSTAPSVVPIPRRSSANASFDSTLTAPPTSAPLDAPTVQLPGVAAESSAASAPFPSTLMEPPTLASERTSSVDSRGFESTSRTPPTL